MSSDYRASDDPALQPYRDPATGRVVTISPEQCAAIRHAGRAWLKVAEAEGYAAAPRIRALVVAFDAAIVEKSCVMGRLLYQGKPLLVDAPPVVWAAPDYSVEEKP